MFHHQYSTHFHIFPFQFPSMMGSLFLCGWICVKREDMTSMHRLMELKLLNQRFVSSWCIWLSLNKASMILKKNQHFVWMDFTVLNLQSTVCISFFKAAYTDTCLIGSPNENTDFFLSALLICILFYFLLSKCKVIDTNIVWSYTCRMGSCTA